MNIRLNLSLFHFVSFFSVFFVVLFSTINPICVAAESSASLSDNGFSYLESMLSNSKKPSLKSKNLSSSEQISLFPDIDTGTDCSVWSKKCSEEILRIAKSPDYVKWIKSARRKIHENPELAFQEFETSLFVRQELDKMEIQYKFPLATTGIRAMIGTGGPPFVGVRADMDALPIQELVEWEHKSKIAGKMHACGHDAHTAMLMGAAKILKTREKHLKGTVVLIFQPAEEAGNGAKRMIADGALADVEAIFAVHISHLQPTAVVGSRRGALLAGCGFFRAVITGKRGQDPVFAGSAAVISLQGIVSREANPLDSKVLSVTFFNSGDNLDAIPDKVEFGGTIRAFSKESFSQIVKRIEEVVIDQARVFRCSATVDFFKDSDAVYPPMVNDECMYEHVKNVAIDLLGPTNYVEVEPLMGSEDFVFYSEVIPAGFYYIGIKNETLGSFHSAHSPHFFIDEDALPVGAATHAAIAERYLNEREHHRTS